jgi:hypothetical protein
LTEVWTSVSTTGHRDLTDSQMAWLRPELDRVLVKLAAAGTTDAASGMAIGADLEFAKAALAAGLRLHAHIPFPEQASMWPPDQQDEYRRLLDLCATRKIYGPSYAVGWLFARNDGLLAVADVLVAVWGGRRAGGTFDTVRKAAHRGLPVIHVDVAALRTHGPGCSCVTALVEPTLF